MIRKILLIIGILLVLLPLLREVPIGVEIYESGINLSLAKDFSILFGALILFIVYKITKSNYFTLLMMIFSTTLSYLVSSFSLDIIAILMLGLYYYHRKKSYGIIFLVSVLPIRWPYFVLASFLALSSMKKKELKKYFIGTILFSPLLYFNIYNLTIEKNIYFAD